MSPRSGRTGSSSWRARSCALLLPLLVGQLIVVAQCQVTDGDEQFEFQHQDIGRISGLSSGSSRNAPPTTIVSRPQQHLSDLDNNAANAPLPPATAQAAAFERSPATGPSGQTRAALRNSQSGSQRKPNRVTLVARRDPQHEGTPQVQATAAAAASPQAQLPQVLVPAQLPAPPHQAQAPVQTVPSAPAEPLQATFAPRHHQQLQLQQQPAELSSPGPALSSFRATGGSVSARHSALVAQVAAERAAAATPSFDLAAGTLSSPSASMQPASFAAAPSQIRAQSAPSGFVSQPEEPLVAPSFEQVLGQGCPQKGVFSWENKEHCDRYYMCTNGTFTEEACPNGLAYSQMGAVYQHCAYNWNVDCARKKTAQPIASAGCPWQFGIFPIVQNGRCSIDYFVCEWGVPDTKRCSPEGLFYDDRIKGCQWADQLGCKSEALLNFKCPPEDEDNPYWPYPRYYHNAQDVIVCVNEQPRLVHCNEDQLVDPSSLACMDTNKNKNKKKQF